MTEEKCKDYVFFTSINP